MSKLHQLTNNMKVTTNNTFEADMLADEIFHHHIYQNGKIAYQDNDVILDIGGNIGLFVLYATSQADGLTIYSCEPIPDLHQLLTINTQEIGNATIERLQTGVGDQAGTRTFRYMPRFPCASTAYPDDSKEKVEADIAFTLDSFTQLRSPFLRGLLACTPAPLRRLIAKASREYHNKAIDVDCPMTTISDLIDRFDIQTVAMLKMDIEGGEVDALRGVRSEHWARIKQVCVETHFGDELFNGVWKILSDNGFDLDYRSNPVAPSDRMVYATRASDAG